MKTKLIAFNMVTLNGYFRGPNHELDWHQTDEAFHDFAVTQLNEAGCLLMGKVTYNLMASYWKEEHAFLSDPVVAEKMHGFEKHVVTSAPDTLIPWNNTSPIHASSVINSIALLKSNQQKHILLLGSGYLLNTLLQAQLVDEVRMMINPVTLSGGTPLLSPDSLAFFKLIDLRTFESGNLLLCYEPLKKEPNTLS